MYKFVISALIFSTVIGSSFGQEAKEAQIKVESIQGAVPWTNLKVYNNPNNFQFAIVTDRTGGHRPGIFEDGIKKLNLLMPEFVLSVGDLIEGYTENEAELNQQWTEFKGFVEQLKMPFFYVPGNHDITNQVMENKWKQLFGPTYYHFVYKNVLFLCLNSEDNKRGSGKGSIDDAQYEYIKKVLAENPKVKWTLAFMHQPLWIQEDAKRWKDVEKLLADRKHTVFVGHVHNYVKYVRNNGKYFTLATTGGASDLRGTGFGEFDHVAWITMTDEGPIIANLLLEGIWDENVSTEAMEKLTSSVKENNLLKIEPILVESLKSEELSTKIKITNDKDIPMQIDLEFALNLDIMPSFAKKTLTINPNSVEFIDLKLKLLNQVALDKLEPLQLKGKATYSLENSPKISFVRTANIKPEKINKINLTKQPITLDGDLKEWKDFPYTVNKPFSNHNPFLHQSIADASFKFATCYDDKFLYIGLQVKDDYLFSNDSDWAFDQDAWGISLDARTEFVSANNTGAWDETLYIVQNPSNQKQEKVFRANSLPEGTKAITQKNKDGYQCEVAIPINYLKKSQGKDDWRNFRLNVLVYDFDEDGKPIILSWQPDWREIYNQIGSGTFYK
jgi:hypothetical protein